MSPSAWRSSGSGNIIGSAAASQMGPGYFPRVLSTILIGLGLISLVRSCIVRGEAVSTILWRPMLQITTSILLFGYLLPRAGMAIALLALCLGSAAASREFRFDWKATAGLLALIVFCVLVFVKGLGIPAPLIGTWLQPIITVRWLH